MIARVLQDVYFKLLNKRGLEIGVVRIRFVCGASCDHNWFFSLSLFLLLLSSLVSLTAAAKVKCGFYFYIIFHINFLRGIFPIISYGEICFDKSALIYDHKMHYARSPKFNCIYSKWLISADLNC